jgi:hypothetical protein
MKCYLVKLKEFRQITPKCYKAVDFSGHEDLIPASQVCGIMQGKAGADVYISAWILEQKSLTYSDKNPVFIEPGEIIDEDVITITRHSPHRLEPEIGVEADASLVR